MSSSQQCSPPQSPVPNFSQLAQSDSSKEQCAPLHLTVPGECNSTALEEPVWSLLQPCLPIPPSTRTPWPPIQHHPLTLGESSPRSESQALPTAPSSLGPGP